MLERFGSNIRSQEAQGQLMSILQGQRPVREYASQFKTLLGRLDGYNETMLLNQFVWGLQLELARSVSLHYPKSITQVVSMAETTELAVKASRRPTVSGTSQKKAQIRQIRAKDSGVVVGGVGEVRVVAEWGILVAVAEDQAEAEEEGRDHPVFIHWHVIGAECVAIWPVTVLNPVAS